MKKILIVDIGPTCGGVEKIVDSIYERLNKEEYNIDFLVYGEKCYNEGKYRNFGTVYKVSRRYSNPLKHYKEIKSFFINHRNYDIVWIQTRSSSNINAHRFSLRYTGAKIITHSHAIKPETRNRFHRVITSLFMKFNQRTLLSCTDYAIACSKASYQYMFGKQYKGKGKTIVNGIELEEFKYSKDFREKIREKYSIPRDTFILGHVGRIVPVKNHRFIVEIFKYVHKEKKNSLLMFVGDGPDSNEIKNYVKQLKLEEYTLFVGEKDNVSEYLSAMDIFVLPSLFEGLSLSAIEAQASGLPTFISDGVPEDAMATSNAYRISLKEHPSQWSKKMMESTGEQKRENAYIELIGTKFDIDYTVNEIKQIFEM